MNAMSHVQTTQPGSIPQRTSISQRIRGTKEPCIKERIGPPDTPFVIDRGGSVSRSVPL